MDEFLKINWRNDLSKVNLQESFISEDVIAESLVYKFFEDKALFRPIKGDSNIKLFQEKPYIPGGLLQIKTQFRSSLDEGAHDICLKALKVILSGKDPSCYTVSEKMFIDFFNRVKPKIMEENLKYQAFVHEQWAKDHKKVFPVKHRVMSWGHDNWVTKWNKITSYPKHYKILSTISTTFNEDESLIDFKCISNVLDVGTVARFAHPTLKSACYLNNVTLPLPSSFTENQSTFSNKPVSKDENITKLLETHPSIDFVISASSLKCLADTSDSNNRWMIPLVVKSITVQKENGSSVTKNVVFLDKPFSQYDVSYMDFAYMGYKRMIKTNLCRHKAFSFEDHDSLLKEEPTNLGYVEGNYSFDRDHKGQHAIHHNATYRIWNIKKTYCQNNLMKRNHKPIEFNVLIRSKIDACECNEQGALQPVILRPKLEMQHKYGANIPSKSELTREWTSLFFTPFSNLYRVRILPRNGEVMYVEKCNIQKIASEAQAHYRYKPQTTLGILQTIFEQLICLKPGNYVLQHLPKHESFIAVLRETEKEEVSEHFNFHAEYDKVAVNQYPKTWLPIDVNFVIPTFEASKRMPGMFTPCKKQLKWKKKKKSRLTKDQSDKNQKPNKTQT